MASSQFLISQSQFLKCGPKSGLNSSKIPMRTNALSRVSYHLSKLLATHVKRQQMMMRRACRKASTYRTSSNRIDHLAAVVQLVNKVRMPANKLCSRSLSRRRTTAARKFLFDHQLQHHLILIRIYTAENSNNYSNYRSRKRNVSAEGSGSYR